MQKTPRRTSNNLSTISITMIRLFFLTFNCRTTLKWYWAYYFFQYTQLQSSNELRRTEEKYNKEKTYKTEKHFICRAAPNIWRQFSFSDFFGMLPDTSLNVHTLSVMRDLFMTREMIIKQKVQIITANFFFH